MNAFLRNLTLGCVTVSSLLCGGMVTAAGLAPHEEPRFKAGDALAVAANSASVMLADQVVGVLPKGQRIVVVEVRDGWVGAHARVDGRLVAGWVQSTDFVPAGVACLTVSEATSGTQVHTAYRPVVTELIPTLVAPARDYGRDEFLIGRQERHETDPNMHVWEPWRR